jgi:hypothetical protein
MIFQHTWQAVLEGRKTQTRRLYSKKMVYEIGKTYTVQPGRAKSALWWKILDGVLCTNPGIVWKPADTLDGYDYEDMRRFDDRATWQKHGYIEGRILITDRRIEDVRNISNDDVRAEGYQTASDFFITWCSMHDKAQPLPVIPNYYTGSIVWQGVRDTLAKRPAEYYQAYVYHFELVKD